MEANTEDRAQVTSMRPFFTVWIGQAFSILGSSLVQFALVWYLTVSTGSATVLAMASLVGFLPQIIVSPFAGALVDRWSRRVVMIVADGSIALATVILALLFALGLVEFWHVYVMLFVRSLGGAFHVPAMLATTTLMVPTKHLARVGGLNQAMQGAASIVAPPSGALLLAILPMQAILAIDVITALIAIAPLVFVFIPRPILTGDTAETSAKLPTKPSVLADVREGLRYLSGWPGLMLICAMGVLIRLLVSPGVALMPILVIRHFGGGALQLASLQATAGIGMVAGGIALATWGGFRRRIVTVILGLTVDGAAILTLGLAPADGFAIAIGAVLVAGVVEPMVHGTLGAIAQATIPPAMQGRIFGLVGSASLAMVPLGLAIAGPVADAFGAQVWFVIGGAAMLAMSVGAFFIPALMTVESAKMRPAAVGSVPER